MANCIKYEVELIFQDYFEINGKGHFNVLEC